MYDQTSEQSLPERLNRAIKADPKKSGVLAVLAIVLIVIVARMLPGSGKARPASAGAAMVGNRNASGGLSVKNSKQNGSSGLRSSSATLALAKWGEAPFVPVSRNLFNVRIDYFPSESSRTLPSGATDEGFWSKLGKSMAVQADQRDRQDNLKANFKAEAEKLRLQSTMTGGTQPRAMVNGELVGEGSVVAGFRILKIEVRKITIEREGIQLEINTR